MISQFPKVFFVTGTDTGVGKTVVSTILTLGLSAHYWKPIQSGCIADENHPEKTRSTTNLDNSSKLDNAKNPDNSSNLDSAKHPDNSSKLDSAASSESARLEACRSAGGSPASNDYEITDTKFLLNAGVNPERILEERFCLSQALSPHLAARLDGVDISLDHFKLPDTSAMKHLIIEGAGGLLVPINKQDKIIDLIQHFAIPVVLVARSKLGTINHTLLSLEAMRNRNIDIAGVVICGEKNFENRKAIEEFGKINILAEVPILSDFSRTTLLNCFEQSFVSPALAGSSSN